MWISIFASLYSEIKKYEKNLSIIFITILIQVALGYIFFTDMQENLRITHKFGFSFSVTYT